MENNNYSTLSKGLILIIFTLFIFSCSPDPTKTVEQYLELTYKKNNAKKAYRLLSKDDQKFKSEEEFILEHKRKNLFNDRLKKKYKEKFSYEIEEGDYGIGDTIRVKALLYKPNSQLALKEMLVYAMASSSSMNDAEKDRFLEKHYENLIQQEDTELEVEQKEFTLIKENGDYKLFFNFGEPHREELLNQKIDNLNLIAEEKIRKMDYEGSKMIYKKMLALRNDETTREKLKSIDETICTQINLGQKKDIGKISVKPLRVEIKKILIEKKNWLGGDSKKEISKENYLVLTFLVSNQFEGEFFHLLEEGRYKRNYQVTDNYGNEMNPFIPDFDVLSVEENLTGKLLPGETRIVKAICEAPLSPKAEKFIWNMKLVVDNQNSTKEIAIRFNRKDIANLN